MNISERRQIEKIKLRKDLKEFRKKIIKLEHDLDVIRQDYFLNLKGKLYALDIPFINNTEFEEALKEVEDLARLVRYTLSDKRLPE